MSKLALGSMHQVVDIRGSFVDTDLGFAVPLSFGAGQGGVFAQRSNIGRYATDTFTVVPEVELQIGWDILPSLRATVAYDWLYLSSVVRPGQQIDRLVTAGLLGGGGGPPGTTRPAPRFDRTDFFAHGLNFGLQYRY